MGDSETTPVWKKLYHVISGCNTTVTTDVVEEILDLCKEKIVKGFLEYRPYTKRSFLSWKQHSGLKDIVEDEEMCNFVILLSKELNLDTNVAWTIMCNFLMFEYFGQIDELKLIIRYDANTRYLIDCIWFFYSADRMFLLKSLRHIFENISCKEYKFYKQFNDFLKSVKPIVLWKNFMSTLDVLINEIDNERAEMVSNEILTRWIHRNNREQVEIVTLLIHVIQFCEVDGNELKDVLTLFLRYGFTRHLLYQPSNLISRPKDLGEIKCAEIGCVLTIMERYWECPGTAKMLPRNIEKNLELLQIQGDNSIVLFAWAILKTTISNSEDAMDYCNRTINDLIQKKIFKSLHDLLICNIFDKCRSGDIVVGGVFRLMTEFIKICADYTYLHEQEGVCYVTAELLKRKGLVVLDYLGPIFQLSMDAFPFVFKPFLEMCKSMLAIPDQYDRIMRLLENIPSFLSEIPWSDHRDTFHLVTSQHLFVDSELFIIPQGTLVEKFQYQGMELAKFKYPFSFFVLLEQFTKSLSVVPFEMEKSRYRYKHLMELVEIGFKFIIHILKNYKGDFSSDIVLKRLVQRLEIVPTQFSEGPMKNFNFIRLFFETKVTLITNNLLDFSEVFGPIVCRNFFPQVSGYNRTHKQLLNQTHFECILYRSLKEEENMKDHSLLIEYLKLIDHMVQKEIYVQEVQLAGVWYALNVVFPLHQQWPYDDDLQMMTICKLCVKIFIKALQGPHEKESEKAYEIVTMCRDVFMFEELMISSYLSVFYKDKFYIQNLMEQESNWANGPILDKIENIRLQMVLLLVIYKIRARLPPTTKCTVDSKINLVITATLSYMINSHNATLRILAYRFLEVLARDENNPLLALLGLDYDQVQRLFLEKLRDPIEDDYVKIQILDLVSTCIHCQHGMTAALFNVTRTVKWHSDFKVKRIEGDTVTDFMIDYLQNIKKSHEYLKSPLQVAILKVMVTLWITGKQHLIKDIIALDAFWPLLLDPLYQEYSHSPTVYSHIFKILATQLDDASSVKRLFFTSIGKFLASEKLMLLWLKYIMKIITSSDVQEDVVHDKQLLVRSWMEFMLMADKDENLRDMTSEKSKLLIFEMCLDGVQFPFANTYCLSTWMNMSLLFISQFDLSFEGKEIMIVEKVNQMNSIIKLHYASINAETRATILTIIFSVLNCLTSYFESNTKVLLEFLEGVDLFVEYEYTMLEGEVWLKVPEDSVTMRELIIPWMMCVYIANKLLAMKNVNRCSLWFSYRNFLPRLIACTCSLLNNLQTLPLAKIALHSLHLYVQSPLAFDFFNINMISFYDRIESPFTAMLVTQSTKIHASDLEDIWITCILLMKFNKAFLKKFQHTTLSTCYTYIKLHGQILHQIMLIPECTVSLRALDLLMETLVFFEHMFTHWQTEWYRKSNNTYCFILNDVRKVANSCLYIILRPKNIIHYILDDCHRLNHVDKVPNSLMAIIMNKLITISGLCFSILYRANQGLIPLLSVNVHDSIKILIQNDFSVPKFELPIPYELTYGKLLCLAHFLSKTLDALSNRPAYEREEDTSENQYHNYIALVEHQDSEQNFSTQKLGAYLRYAMYEYSGLADPWIHKLDQQGVRKALELLMTFLGQQVFLFIRTADFDSLPYFKRNLASELQFFYEYVKKHTSILFIGHISASVRAMSNYKSDIDILKKYLMLCRTNDTFYEVSDHNFGIAIIHWFANICYMY